MVFSLTQALLASDTAGFQRATQSSFLHRAAQGKVDRTAVGKWLANDRLYILAYIQGIGRTLSFLALPQTVSSSESEPRREPATRLLDWLLDAMVNIRREEKFFVDTAHRFGIEVNLPSDRHGRVTDSEKLPGLLAFEALFSRIGPSEHTLLPWLESAVIFYGTEKCYLEAWTWARNKQDGLGGRSDGSGDADGGALRNEFIPNWTGREFVAFVDQLGTILDDAVDEVVRLKGGDAKAEIVDRALGKWRELLAAEEAFWPETMGDKVGQVID